MKPLALSAASVASLAMLTACSQTTAPPSPVPSSRATVTHSAPVVNCSQRYNSWIHGPGKSLVAALSAVYSADTTGKVQELAAALMKARPAVASAARYPLPACADPKGYWDLLLMHVNAAASTNSGSSQRAAMKGMPEIQRNLTAELKRIPG